MSSEKSEKKIDYNSLKVVMKYLDPNVRIALVRRTPTLRTVDSLVPLQTNSVQMSRYRTVINNTCYQVGIFREYHGESHCPFSVSLVNQYGGVQADLDQWGLLSDQLPLTGLYTEIWANIKAAGVGGGKRPTTAYWNTNQELTGLDDEYRRTHGQLKASIYKVQTMIEDMNLLSELRGCKENGWPVPFIMQIMVTVRDPSRTCYYYYPYTIPLDEAMCRVNWALFGGRRVPVRTKRFELDAFQLHLRLPKELKFQVKALIVFDFNTNEYRKDFLDLCEKFVHSSSYPLDYLRIDGNFHQVQDLHHILNAKKINIYKIGNQESWFTNISKLLNPAVHVATNSEILNLEDCILIYEEWIKDGRDIGTCHCYGLKTEECVMEFLEMVRKRINGEIKDKRSITVPVNSTSCIHISYHFDDFIFSNKYILRMEIVPIPRDFS